MEKEKMGTDKPLMLLFLTVIPLFILFLRFAEKRRNIQAIRFTAADILEKVAPISQWRRVLPPALFLLALCFAVVALARPYRNTLVSKKQTPIIFALDVSLSMKAQDVRPTRLDAAKQATVAAIRHLPSDVQTGIVSFAQSAFTEVMPTRDHEQAISAVQDLRLREGTAVGNGIIASIDLIDQTSEKMEEDAIGKLDSTNNHPQPGAIILLSDGDTKSGIDPLQAARKAADERIPIYTIAFGTDNATVDVQGEQIPVSVDEKELLDIASVTQGEFFRALNADSLTLVFKNFSAKIGLETVRQDITPFFAITAASMLLFSLGFSVFWFGRLM